MGYQRNLVVFLSPLLISIPIIFAPRSASGCGCLIEPPPSNAEVIISPETLNGFITQGYGNDAFGNYKMVILDADSRSGYAAGHVPGAYLLEDKDLDLGADTMSQAAARAKLDGIIQEKGIDGNTVVVITGGTMTDISRAYWNFRNWGFPREDLKVMNGTNATYAEAGFALDTAAPPTPRPSAYSVCSLLANTFVRASFNEMIAVVHDSDPRTVAIDGRSPEYDVFGHVRIAVIPDYTALLDDGSPEGPLVSAEDLKSAMAATGIDGSVTTYSYCSTSSAVAFLALDAVLGWPARIYDGGCKGGADAEALFTPQAETLNRDEPPVCGSDTGGAGKGSGPLSK